MKRKSYLSILLTLAMLFSLALSAGVSASADGPALSPKDQLKLISSQVDSTLMQKNTVNP